MKRKDLFQAFALGFPSGEEAPPALVARGEFDMAAFMVSVARRYGIPVVEKPEMCETLEAVDIDQSIPERLFEAAAALFVELGVIQRKDRE